MYKIDLRLGDDLRLERIRKVQDDEAHDGGQEFGIDPGASVGPGVMDVRRVDGFDGAGGLAVAQQLPQLSVTGFVVEVDQVISAAGLLEIVQPTYL